jgi:colanic acid/amylovoran/stewartan biosynthesis glycosyltransferase WcaL/AmsK/CpsK
MQTNNPITVLQSTPVWLPQTMTWLYNQVRFLPPEISSHIVCEQTTNLNQFNLPNIHCSKTDRSVRWLWDYALNAIRWRPYFSHQIQVAQQLDSPILHSHFGDRGWADIKVAQTSGLKHIVTFYGFDVNRLPLLHPKWKTRYARLFDHVNKVLCEGIHMADCIRNLGCPQEKIQVQHLGIDLEGIPFKPRIWSTGKPLRFLIAASFREKKGIPYALEALGRLKNDFPLEITLIGDATQEDRSIKEKEKILKIINRYQLHPNVRMLGFQPMDVLYKEAYEHHIFLSPSVTAEDGDTEGGAPVSILEMLASGMPVVSTRHCDIPSIIHHEESGLLAEERNVEEMIQHIQWLTQNPSAWKSLVENGRLHLETEYSAKTQGIRLAQIYQEIHD